MVDDTKRSANIHQDYSLDQTMLDIKTSVMTFHLTISNDGASRFYLFLGIHKEILHNLTTLKYIRDHKVPIDKKMEMYAGGISEYVIDKNQLPYDDQEDTVVTFSHFSRYPQSVYILDKYKTNDIVGYKVDTKPGEFVLFDPAILHSGAYA